MNEAGAPEKDTIMLVDDDAAFRFVTARALRSRGYRVLEAGDYPAAVTILRVSSPRYAVIDVGMRGPSGLDILRSTKEIRPNTIVLILTGDHSADMETQARLLGATSYLAKPADADEVLAALTAIRPNRP